MIKEMMYVDAHVNEGPSMGSYGKKCKKRRFAASIDV